MKFINLRPEFRPTDFFDEGASDKVVSSSQANVPIAKLPPPKQSLTNHNQHQQMTKPVPPPIPVSRSQSITTHSQSSPKRSPIVVQNLHSVDIRHNVHPPLPQSYQVQHQFNGGAQYNHQQTSPQTPPQQQSNSKSSPNQRSPLSTDPLQQQQHQHFQYPRSPLVSIPQQPAPPILQPRNQTSNQNATNQPQPSRQLFQNVNVPTGTSSESLQESHLNQFSPASGQTSLHTRQQHQQQQHHRSDSLDTGTRASLMMPPPPPRPPPRRRQSSASLFKPSPTKQPIETRSRVGEIHDLAKRGLGRVKEHALKLNSSASSSDLNALMPIRNNSMKENRLSRDLNNFGTNASALQRNSSHLTNRSRSSHREDESDSSSLQPTDPLRRRWALEASNCNYNGLIILLKEDPKLASHKDITNGYTALHWAAKFGNLDIIKLIAGTHNVSADMKSSAGYTPLHVAYMFNRYEVAELLQNSYKANPNIRDHSGKRPKQYGQQQKR